MADLNLVARIMRIPDVRQMKADIRYARDLSVSGLGLKTLLTDATSASMVSEMRL